MEDFNIKIKHPSELIKDIEMDAKSLLESISNISYKLNNLKIEKTNLQTLKLEDISLSKEIKLGKPLPKDNIESGEIPYVNISDITRCTTDYLDSSEVMISDDFAYRNNLTVVEPNSILLSSVLKSIFDLFIFGGKTLILILSHSAIYLAIC